MDSLLAFITSIGIALQIVSPPSRPLPVAQLYDEANSPYVSFAKIKYTPPVSAVLGVQSPEHLPPSTTPTPTHTLIPLKTKKLHMTIALVGDSMIETLGVGVPDLRRRLSAYYPASTFTIHNYGVGGTNIDSGIARLTHGYIANGYDLPPLSAIKPDLVIFESFAYNHYPLDETALTRHWLAMAKAVDSVRTNLPDAKLLLASTITPNSKTFGDGAPSISYTEIEKHEQVVTIKAFLDNTVRFARSEKIPLANAYNPSVMRDGDGNWTYISRSDHIHYSTKGRLFFADTIFEAIRDNKLLE